MGIHANGGDTIGDGKHRFSLVVLDERHEETSKTHINMHWDVFGLTVASNLLYGIDCSVGIVRAASVNTDRIVVDFTLGVSDAHPIILIVVDKPYFNVEVFACLNGSNMSGLADQEIRFCDALAASVLSKGKDCHENRLSSTCHKHTNWLSVICKVVQFRAHLNHLNLHLPNGWVNIEVKRIAVNESRA